jgi:hypothetical protein
MVAPTNPAYKVQHYHTKLRSRQTVHLQCPNDLLGLILFHDLAATVALTFGFIANQYAPMRVKDRLGEPDGGESELELIKIIFKNSGY